MATNTPTLVFGSGTVGSERYALKTAKDVEELLVTLKQAGIDRLDVTPRHPPGHNFLAETLFGQAAAASKGFTIDVKNLFDPRDPSGSLGAQALQESITGSLGRLGLDRANVFYAYVPDRATPLEEQAATMDALHRRGLFTHLGLSNFPLDLVERWVAISEEKGYVRPTVYQNQYNLVCRGIEEDILPALRRHGISLVAYSPLAGGFLAGTLTSGEIPAGSRLAAGDPVGQHIRGQYDKPRFHEGVRRAVAVLQPRGITLPEASVRWLYWHSRLGAGDGIILGASRSEQVEANVKDIRKGPLPQDVLEVLDGLYASAVEKDSA